MSLYGQIAGQVEAGLQREDELHEKLTRCEPATVEWKDNLAALSRESRLTSLKWKQHFFARLARRGLTLARQERFSHLGGLVEDLRLRVHPKALRKLIKEENSRRCDPPLSSSSIETLLRKAEPA